MLKIIPLSLENATNQGKEAFEVGIADVWKICCNIISASSCVCVCVCEGEGQGEGEGET